MEKEADDRHEWNIEFFKMIADFMEAKKASSTQILAFLTINFIGTLYNAGFNEGCAADIFEKMKGEYSAFKKWADEEDLKNMFQTLKEEEANEKREGHLI